MLATESYQIEPVECWISRGGLGVVEDHNVKTKDDHVYYKIEGRETRYCIIRPTRRLQQPSLIYETPTKNECFFASGLIRQTRNFIRPLDRTYFKFFDDAEEVKNNIISFITWLQKVPTLNLKKMDKKGIMNTYGHLLMDVPPTPEWEKILNLTYVAKKRSDLSPLARDLQDELDLIPESR